MYPFISRPYVTDFDPSNAEHRQAVIDFRRRRSWSDTKLRFSYDPNYGCVASQVESKLLQWYIKKEFPNAEVQIHKPPQKSITDPGVKIPEKVEEPVSGIEPPPNRPFFGIRKLF